MRKKVAHAVVTFVVMLVVSRFVVRIVDATVQIDDDLGALALLLSVVNAAIMVVSSWTYRRSQGHR